MSHALTRSPGRDNTVNALQISYLEIYNDVAYDLLNVVSGSTAKLPKVDWLLIITYPSVHLTDLRS